MHGSSSHRPLYRTNDPGSSNDIQREVALAINDTKYAQMQQWARDKFNVITCQELYTQLVNDDIMSDTEKLATIREHKDKTQKLCREFTNLKTQVGNDKHSVQVLLHLAQVTWAQLRINFTRSISAHAPTDDELEDTQSAMSTEDCVNRMNGDCTELFRLEQQLITRIGSRWNRWSVKRVLSVIKEGSHFVANVVLKTGKVVRRIFDTMADIAQFCMPLVIKAILYTLASPTGALISTGH
jgi:hypothetical protein